MNKLNKQFYLCKCKTLVFHFSTYRPSSFKGLSHLSKSSECPMQRTMLAAVQVTDE